MLLVVVLVDEELMRVLGRDCSVDVEHVARRSRLFIGAELMTELAFDLSGDQMG